MSERKYVINVGTFSDGETVHTGRCLCAGIGGEGVLSETVPWEGTEYNPWDYKYEAGAFVLDPITLPVQTPVPTRLDRIEAQVFWTGLMTDTLIESEE